jgi:hypothetical protein
MRFQVGELHAAHAGRVQRLQDRAIAAAVNWLWRCGQAGGFMLSDVRLSIRVIR